ncbi:LOW QUALITY PROTEIN: little elongation complex subunit 2-like [Haliotis rubra]|uniref:LOW QUALITY PROTEIN: little elongation complex subunit 2-like n=1 Tax=Haliotis rubra TaxID=36100 RepID=UPI001EE5154B|nr:LOW QUALITY PROTEIN: little elongation complex subunit 2-like [Haliotis rubra]
MDRYWKEPINGTTAFFSEESFTRVLGSVSLQERLAIKFNEIRGDVQSLPGTSQYQAHASNTDATPTQGPNRKDPGDEAKKKQAPALKKDAISQPGQTTKNPKARKSSLSCKEQRRYLELFQKYLVSYRPQQPTQAEIKELTEFEALQHRVNSEQADFLKYTELVANSRYFEYGHLVPAARKYVDEKLNQQWRRVDQYARYYVPHKTIQLSVPSSADYAPTLEHQKLLLELGSFPKIFLPDMSRAQIELPVLYDKINKRFPSTGRKTRNSQAWNHEVCSRDINAEILAERHGCQLVTCSASLKCLVDNHAPKFDRDWEIPVVIKQYEHDYGDISTKQRVVYIDKPFAPKVMTSREKNTMYHKYALKTFISHPGLPKGQRLATHNTPATSAKEDKHSRPKSANPFDEDVNMEDLETFGSFDFSKPAKTVEMKNQEGLVDLESFGIITGKRRKSETKMDNRETSDKSKIDISKPLDGRNDSKINACEQMSKIGSDKEDFSGSKSVSSSARPSDGGSETKQTDTPKLDTSDASKVPKKVTSVPKVPKFSSSGGDTSQEDSLVIDLPESPSPSPRTTRSTRSQAKKKESESSESKSCPEVVAVAVRSSPRLTRQTDVGKDLISDSTDDESGLIIDFGDENESENESTKRKTRSQGRSVESNEFPVPKRILRKRKTEQMRTSVESESDNSPDRHSSRVTRSRSNSESKACDDPDSVEAVKEKVTKTLSVTAPDDSGKDGCKEPAKTSSLVTEVSPSKVDTIMMKTSTDDLSQLPATKEGKDMPPSAKRPGRRKTMTTAGVSPLDSILQMQEKMLPTATRGQAGSSGQDTEENLSQFRQPEEHNTSYNLWNFSGLSLLVRNSCHGILKGLTQKTQPVLIVPKLEYQVKFGVEQVTISEVSRDWISCYTKPSTKLVRGRINAFTSELVKIDELELNSIVNPSLPFVPSNALASLHSLFLNLTELPVGQYLLRHSKGDNSCQLQKQTDNKRGSYDLKFSYMGFGQSVAQKTESSVPWIPIDPTVLLPAHRKRGRIPCTFEPSDYIPQKQRKMMNTKNKKNKKGQKKKKSKGKQALQKR